MPIYCNKCEDVIKKLRHKVKKINCCGEQQWCYMYGTDEEVNAAVYMGDLPTIEDCEGYYDEWSKYRGGDGYLPFIAHMVKQHQKAAKYRFCLWIETEAYESDDLAELELVLMPYILEEGEWELEI